MKLIKLADKLILPLTVLIFARYLGVFVAEFIYLIRFELFFGIDHLSVPFVSFSGPADFYLANAVSWLFVGLALAIYFGFTLFRFLHLHEDHIHPKQIAFLHRKYLEHLVINAEDATYQIVGWLLLSTVAFLAAFADFSQAQVPIVVFSSLFSITIVLISASLFHLVERSKSKS